MDAQRSRSPSPKARKPTTSAPPSPNAMRLAARIARLAQDKGKPMHPSTIGGINKLPEIEKREIYSRYIPRELIEKFNLYDLTHNKDLLQFRFADGASDVEMMLYHQVNFPDPILYAHLADNVNGQIHVLLYILND